MRALSLFSGIGMHDLGLRRAGYEIVAQCEIDPWCLATLENNNFPDSVRFTDVHEVDGEVIELLGGVDLVTGGFPCQDISVAGKGAGLDGARSGLWWEMRRIVSEVRPRWLLIENVPALRLRGADGVLAALEELGYACWPCVVGAWAIGAPHKRDRVWIVARLDNGDAGRYLADTDSKRIGDSDELRRIEWARGAGAPDASGGGLEELADDDRDGRGGQTLHLPEWGPQQAVPDAPGASAGLPDPESAGLEGLRPDTGRTPYAQPGDVRWPARPGERQHEWEAPRLVNSMRADEPKERESDAVVGSGGGERASQRRRPEQPARIGAASGDSSENDTRQPQPRLGGATDGRARRLDSFARRNRLKALGNANPWIVPYLIGRWILEVEAEVNEQRRSTEGG